MITEEREILLPRASGGRLLAYYYEDIKIRILQGEEPNYSALEPGMEVTLFHEEDNEYDPMAIALYVGDTKIGYLDKNRLQDMVHRFTECGNPIRARIGSADERDGIKIVLGFYQLTRSSITYNDNNGGGGDEEDDDDFMDTCPYCDGKVNYDAKKCRHCGEWLVDRPEKPEKTKEPSSAYTGAGCMTMAIVVISLFLGIWIHWIAGLVAFIVGILVSVYISIPS